MKIPAKINILGQEHSVEFDDTIVDLGRYVPDLNRILLKKTMDKIPIPDDKIYLSFWHEVLHGILINLEYRDLYADEEFIGRVSGAIYQIIKQIKNI